MPDVGPERDRFVDLLRAASIVAVVLGHWLIAAVVDEPDGLRPTNVLTEVSWARLATWVLQAVPVFFVVGGFASHRALTSGSGGVGPFLGRRLQRLLRPTLAFVAVWLLVAPLLVRLPVDEGLVDKAIAIAAQPLWFLAAYLAVMLVAPVQLAAHRRHPVALLAGLVVVVVALDALRLGLDLPGPAYANYLVVFVAAQELGFWYADGTLLHLSPGRAAAVGLAGLAALVTLTTVGPYPVSMVGVAGDDVSNMSPPTLCIVVLTVTQVSFLLAARPALGRWLQRPGPWRATVAVNLVVLTLFLWHLTALVAAGGLLLGLGAPQPDPGSAAWWAWKPVWLLLAAMALAGLVAVWSPIERAPGRAVPGGWPAWRGVTGTLAAATGLAGFALAGFAGFAQASGRVVLGVQASPAVALGLVVAGWLLGCGRPGPGHRATPPPPTSTRVPGG